MLLKSLEWSFIVRMDQNEEIIVKYLNDNAFQTEVGKKLLKEVYDQIHNESKDNTNPK